MQILKIGVPMILAFLAYSLIGLADVMCIAHLGEWAVSGVGLATSLMFAIQALSIGTLEAVSILTASNVHDKTPSLKPLQGGTTIGILVGSATALLVLIFHKELANLAASEESREAAQSYLRIASVSLIPIGIFQAQSEYLSGLGKTKLFLIGAIAISVTNIILNIVLVYGMGLGPEGTAYASTTASIVGVLSLSWWAPPKPSLDVHKVLTIGVPLGIRFLVGMLTFTVGAAVTASYSDTAGALYQWHEKIVEIPIIILVALTIAARIHMGQHQTKEAVLICLRVLAITSVVCTGGILFVSCFARALSPLLIVSAVFLIARTMSGVERVASESWGNTRATSAISIIRDLTGAVLAYALCNLGMGALGAVLAINVGFLISWPMYRKLRVNMVQEL